MELSLGEKVLHVQNLAETRTKCKVPLSTEMSIDTINFNVEARGYEDQIIGSVSIP